MASRIGKGFGPNFTAALGLGLTGNYSMFAVPAAWVIALIPGFYSMQVFNQNKYPGQAEFDLTNPDANMIRSSALPQASFQLFTRARKAHSNALVNLPLFAGAVIVGHVARLPAKWMNAAAGAYLALRSAYIWFYLNGTTNKLAMRRSMSWTASNLVCLAVFIASGLKVKDGY